MDERDGDGAFADGGCYAFHVSGSDVADGKNAGHAGFEHQRSTRERPLGEIGAAVSVGSGRTVSVPPGVSRSRPVRMKPLLSSAMQPRSHSVRGDAPAMMKTWRMSRTDVLPVVLSCQVTRSRCESPSSRHDFGVIVQFDGGIFLDALDKIAGHGVG